MVHTSIPGGRASRVWCGGGDNKDGGSTDEWRRGGGGGGRQYTRARTLGGGDGVTERQREEGCEARLAVQAGWDEHGAWRRSSGVADAGRIRKAAKDGEGEEM